MSIKTMNDLEAAYNKGLIERDGLYICPVCSKEYKRKSSAEKHLEAQDCYSLRELYANTVYETRAYAIYKKLIGMVNTKASVQLGTFKKSNYYNGIMRLTLFLNLHSLNEQQDTYFTWLNEFKGCQHIPHLTAEGIKESNLREFRRFLAQFEQFIDSEIYYKKYRDMLVADTLFFVRALETAKVGLNFILAQKDFPFETVMANADADSQFRFEEFANMVLMGKGE